ncbi:hypothetical protein BDW72DRAFT_189252 [Aspergillus terricola var. indicus]
MVLQAERNALPGWRKFVYNGMWKRTLAGFTVQMWQQNSGANYVVYIFMMANLTGNINLVSSATSQSHSAGTITTAKNSLHNSNPSLRERQKTPQSK